MSWARRWSLLVALALVAGAGALGVGVLRADGDSEGSSAQPRTAPGEILLGAEVPATARRDQGEAERPRRARQRPRPAAASAASEEAPPAHILRENAKLRRDLEDLKALERERAGVARALNAAGGFDGPLRVGKGGLTWPVTGPLVSPFGPRWGRLHAGIDIAAPAGRPIRAAARGRVAINGPTGGYGNYACVQHTRTLTSCYAHMSRSLTEKGAVVDQGDVIGLVGCTGHCFGAHLHFETWVGGRPTDPMPYL